MAQVHQTGKLITFFATWDEDVGPKIVDYFPKTNETQKTIDLQDIAIQVFSSFQIVFGRSSEVSFEKTNLVLPLKSYKRIAKILMDSVLDRSVRGGRLPFIMVVLSPADFPENQLPIFTKIQEQITNQYISKKKINLQEYHSEIISLVEEVAEQAYNNGENQTKDKLFQKAVDNYELATTLMDIAGNTYKYNHFFVDLNQARIHKAELLLSQAKNLAKKGQTSDSLQSAKDAQFTVEKTHNKEIIKHIMAGSEEITQIVINTLKTNGQKAIKEHYWKDAEAYLIEGEKIAKDSKFDSFKIETKTALLNLYTKWALTYKEGAKKLLNKNEYSRAIDFLKEGVKITDKSDNKHLQKIYLTELYSYYASWSKEKANEAHLAYKQKNFDNAHRIYLEAINLAKTGKNNKLQLKLETILAKIPNP